MEFENGGRMPSEGDLAAIRKALESAGVWVHPAGRRGIASPFCTVAYPFDAVDGAAGSQQTSCTSSPTQPERANCPRAIPQMARGLRLGTCQDGFEGGGAVEELPAPGSRKA
jgi:hypothetical protein